MSTRILAIVFTLGLHLSVGAAGTNSWTKLSSGYWEEPFWSLGVLPAFDQAAIEFTNPGFKALAIGQSTITNDPASLRIRNLTIDAPPDSGNLLLLNYAGLNVPLDVTGWLTIGTNGSLLSYYSAIDGDSLMLQGLATFAELARTRFSSVYLTNRAELVLSNGWFEALTEALQSIHGTNNGFLYTEGSTWSQYGGTNQFASMTVESDSTYNLYDGTLKHMGSQPVHVGTTVGPTEGTLHVAGGIADLGEVVLGDIYDGPGFLDESRGQVLLYDGIFKTPRLVFRQGKVIQYGGTSQAGLMLLPGPNPGPAFSAAYRLQGGHLQSSSISVGETQAGSFYQDGGSHTNGIGIVVYDRGLYEFFGGQSSAPRIELRGGHFRQSSPTNYVATNYCPQLFMTAGGSFEQFNGLLITFNMLVSQSIGSNYPSGYIQTGGEHRAGAIIIDSGGLYSLWRGTLSANSITVGAMGEFQLSSNSVITTNGTFELRGGGRLLLYSGINQLGSLRVSGNATVDFSTNSSSTIRFRDAGYTTGALDAALNVVNWTHARDHFYVGSITDAQLRLITFVNPGGYPPGNYRARVTPDGEIVPLESAQITFTRRDRNTLVLTWPEGYQLLSATEVTGPYEPVADATSPYEVSFTDPHRFFILAPTTP